MTNKFALMAIPIMATLMVGISLIPANATGIYCGTGEKVVHGVQNSWSAYANLEGPNYAQFYYGQLNCSNDKGQPERFGSAFINVDGCFTSMEITRQNFEHDFEFTVLTLEGTSCGDIVVEWIGDGNTQENGYANTSGENCHDGKYVMSYMQKFQYGQATLYVDGEEVSTSIESDDAAIYRGSELLLNCQTGDSP